MLMRHGGRFRAAVAAVMAMVIVTAPGALAEPDPTEPVPTEPVPTDPVVDTAVVAGGAVADAPTLSLADLGAKPELSFFVTRNVTTTTLSFPVPAGLAPVELRANIELPVNLRFGNLAVSQGERTISRMGLPPEDQAEMIIPLAGVVVTDNRVEVTLTMNALPLEGYCWDPAAPVRLVNGVIRFVGAELVPTTIAGFLPPVLRKVTIAVPAAPSPAESTAAVQVAAAVAKREDQLPEVVVVPLPDGATTLPTPSAPLERQIIVKEGPDAGLSLQPGPGVPALLISGPGAELANQTRLLADDSLRFATSARAVADTLPGVTLPDDTVNLEELTGSGVTGAASAEALWPRLGIEIDQTRWGHPVADVSVRVIGSYTPLPTNFGGELIATAAGETLARWPTDAAGTIDRTVTIPNRLLQRYNSLDISMRTTGDPGTCGDRLPVVIRTDGKTVISLTRSTDPSPPGFQSLPQALMPRIRIGIGPDAFADTVRAAQITVGLQRASRLPLAPEVIPLQQAIEGTEPAILIAADGWNDTEIVLPFSEDRGKITVAARDAGGQPVTLTLDPAMPFASLQTVFDGQRSILVATSNGAAGQLDELLRYLAVQPARWPALDGRAVISVPGTDPMTVANPPAEFATQEDRASGGRGVFWWVVGGVAVVAALGALAILIRARRTQPPLP